MSETKQLTAIRTDAAGMAISIDGVLYRVTDPLDMTLGESLRLTKLQMRVFELYQVVQGDDPPAAAAEEFDDTLVAIVDVLLKEAPGKVRTLLKQLQRMRILLEYLKAMPAAEKKEGEANGADPLAGSASGATP
jgi:hypothetical protein